MVPEILKKLYLVLNECCKGGVIVIWGCIPIDSAVIAVKETWEDNDGVGGVVVHNCVGILWIVVDDGGGFVDISTGFLNGNVGLSVDLTFTGCTSEGLNMSPLS